MDPKIIKLLGSKNYQDVLLGLEICYAQFPNRLYDIIIGRLSGDYDAEHIKVYWSYKGRKYRLNYLNQPLYCDIPDETLDFLGYIKIG